MIIKEYRIVLPISMQEFQVAHLFSVAQVSKNETGGGEGVEILQNHPYKEEGGGQYTHKLYHFESRVPTLVRSIVPRDLLKLNEESWKSFPKSKTILTNEYLRGKFEVKIDTIYVDDAGTSENIHNLPEDVWRKVEVVYIDIANDEVPTSDYSELTDPQIFRSEKAQRGPLGRNWIHELKNQQANEENHNKVPVICAYKLVACSFDYWPMQSQVEKLIHRQERRFFTKFHRQVFCWMDSWYGLTIDEIRQLEDQTKRELQEMMTHGEKRGTRLSD